MEHFNKLTPSEAERLAYLLEELGEAQQAIGKILRHGYENYHPDFPEITNREDLEKELGHVVGAINMMIDASDLSEDLFNEHHRKQSSLKKYLHHQQ